MAGPLIIVGAGSAGCVLAARLTEGDGREVLLVEAGPDYAQASLPLDLTNGSHNSMRRHDWGFRHHATTGGWTLALPRGKVVGGSSAVNTCIALRGHPRDYDEWGSRGLRDWSWEQCLPAFLRVENDLDFDFDGASLPHHRGDGPLPIRRHPPDELMPWQVAFLEACQLLGYPACPDANAPGSTGVGPLPMNKVHGKRVSAAQAYLTPEVRARKGFTLQPKTLVRRILFRGRRVCGLELENAEGTRVVETDNVVLAAGALNTPGVLVRSGVGPRKTIERLGIPLIADVPAIGAQLLDHPGAAIFLRPRWGSGFRRDAPLLQTVLRYSATGSAHPCDMQLQPGSRVPLARTTLPLVSLMCALNKPRGVGMLQFVSADPHAKPRVESHFLEDPRDRDQAVEAMHLAFALSNTPEMKKLAGHFWPGPAILGDRDRTRAWIRRACGSGYHPSGTVPMGADDDKAAATDGRGRVRGVEGLTVADASLMPTIPAANIHLSVLMIGERLAGWLREA